MVALRRRFGLTQEDLARILGTTVVQIDRWEHGYGQPGEAEMALISSADLRGAAA